MQFSHFEIRLFPIGLAFIIVIEIKVAMFFIPCFKWNKHYYVQTSCCNTLYELVPEIGKAIARGQQVEIQPEHLTRVSRGSSSFMYKHCSQCGYETAEDFEFCPKCGKRF